MFLSIVVPIYNVESYIEKCFDSLFKQDLSISLYEIIAVNDGSLDRSMDIVEKYAGKYDNIVIYNKPNGGVSSARNAGIKLASGDYIIFVDPDDYIAENSLSKIYENLKKESADMLMMRSFIKGGLIEAAGCFLPLSYQNIDKSLGTRHRAALGISEVSDSAVIGRHEPL